MLSVQEVDEVFGAEATGGSGSNATTSLPSIRASVLAAAGSP